MLKMSCQNLVRRYLHLVMSEGSGLYSLRQMDVSKLFYPSTAEALDAEARAKTLFSSVNWGEKHCIRIPVAFRLYLVKIIQILTN
jgi:hypothetical protein